MRVFNLDKKKYYKNMFLCAGLWNFVVGLIFLLASIIMLPTLVASYDLEVPPSSFFIHGFLVLVIVLGIGFFIVSKDISKNHGIVQMSVVEKFLIFIVFLIYFLMGDFNFLMFIPAIVDLILGILFLEFVINIKKL